MTPPEYFRFDGYCRFSVVNFKERVPSLQIVMGVSAPAVDITPVTGQIADFCDGFARGGRFR
jgi:hypothetical protein